MNRRTDSLISAPCTECDAIVTPDTVWHRGLWLRGARICIWHAWCFCSRMCVERWWRSGAQTDLHPVDTPATVRPGPAPMFYYADASTPGWQPSWAARTYDRDFCGVVWTWAPGQVFCDFIKTEKTLQYRIRPECVDGVIPFRDPIQFNAWWRAPQLELQPTHHENGAPCTL